MTLLGILPSLERQLDQDGINDKLLLSYIFTDGKSYIRPKLIFAGTTGPKATIKKTEGHLYYPDITVEFNPTAYNNEDLFLKSIAEEIIPALGSGPSLPTCYRAYSQQILHLL
ncbi:hypothetical protein L211DRAFT_51815 [Terfezia boudieri ATCC MYA-4762]|uniref:Uncharacterized protein n=1 Tax=Terfezia boudieri ATCC MYA-4762 TaxID=1051890 RepID=A0A3N4M448_9PEZI|nr:hypothetical protein L211DRAFT_51815 [Terfezia boudieri ATCC MYA-4762]